MTTSIDKHGREVRTHKIEDHVIEYVVTGTENGYEDGFVRIDGEFQYFYQTDLDNYQTRYCGAGRGCFWSVWE